MRDCFSMNPSNCLVEGFIGHRKLQKGQEHWAIADFIYS